MADHDRDAGSRGEEEAPRDPIPGRRLHRPGVDPEPGGLKYGEGAERGYAYIPPTTPIPDAEPPSAFRDFLRRRKTQVVSAGVLGLLAGALLGGVTVGAVTERGGHDINLVPDRRPLVPPDAPHFPPLPAVDHDEGRTGTG